MDAPPGGSGFGGREKVCGEAEDEVQSWERRSQHWGLLGGGHSRLDTAEPPLPEPRALPACWGWCWPNTPGTPEVAMVGQPTGFCP